MIPAYWKEPYGSIYSHRVGNYLYGYLTNHEPTNISYKYLHQNIYDIVLAPYTKEWLESKFKKSFPNIRFTYKEIELIPYAQLITLCSLTNTFPKKKNHASMVRALRKTLRDL